MVHLDIPKNLFLSGFHSLRIPKVFCSTFLCASEMYSVPGSQCVLSLWPNPGSLYFCESGHISFPLFSFISLYQITFRLSSFPLLNISIHFLFIKQGWNSLKWLFPPPKLSNKLWENTGDFQPPWCETKWQLWDIGFCSHYICVIG